MTPPVATSVMDEMATPMLEEEKEAPGAPSEACTEAAIAAESSASAAGSASAASDTPSSASWPATAVVPGEADGEGARKGCLGTGVMHVTPAVGRQDGGVVAVAVALCVAALCADGALDSDALIEGDPDDEAEIVADEALDCDGLEVGSGERRVTVAKAEAVADKVRDALCVWLAECVGLELALCDDITDAEAVVLGECDGGAATLLVGLLKLDASEVAVGAGEVEPRALALLDARPVSVAEALAESVIESEELAVLDAERVAAADADAGGDGDVGKVHTRALTAAGHCGSEVLSLGLRARHSTQDAQTPGPEA